MKDQADKEQVREWVETWRRAGPELERIRREEIRATDTMGGLEAFKGLVRRALDDCPPRATSGLVEQQAIFSRLRS